MTRIEHPARRSRLARWLAAALVGLAAITAAAPTAVPANAATWEPITGRGSTWSQNALDQWRGNVASNYGMLVNYTGEGSTAGRTAYILDSVDFAVSEIPFQSAPEDGSAPERPPRGFAYLPIVAGGTAFMYHLVINGRRVTNLRLSGETITGIFTGTITNWNDERIQRDNPGLTMPDRAIVPVVRSDGSGTTAQFTMWMAKQHQQLWDAFCASVGRATPCGLTSQYPVPAGSAFKAQSGSSGVAGYVSQGYGEGSITYVEYSYAIESGFPVAKVLNQSGFYIEPTAPSVAVALLAAQINEDPASPDYLTQNLDGVYGNGDPRTYPLSSYSYLIVPTEVGGVFTELKGATLGEFTNYVLCEGQQQAADLGYSPLPMNLVLAGFRQIARIPGAGAVNPDPNRCNNPTFLPGESPSNNQLAATAPYPADCDRAGGTTQCTTGTAGAREETPSGDPGQGDPGAVEGEQGDAGGGTAGAAGTAGGGGGTVAFDENGNPISGSGVAGRAVSAPFALSDGGWGVPQTLMVVAGLFLLAGTLLPPALWGRFGRPKGGERR